MTLHEIPRQSPPLVDIVARLRNMADRIEAGLVRPDLALLVLRFKAAGLPVALSTFAWGNYYSPHECDGILLAAATTKGSFGEVEA